MSNRLTFSLASLIFILALGLVFAPTSVMAHDLDGTTPGDQHAATGGATLDAAAHSDQHLSAPTVESIELVDIMVDSESTASGSDVVLVADPTAATPALADGDTAVGQFVVKITFSAPLYGIDGTAGGPTTTLLTAPAATDLTITAAAQSAPGANLVGVTDAAAAVVAAAPSADDPTTADTEDSTGRVFYVTFSVGQNLFGDQTGDADDGVPIDVWITVNPNVGASATRLVDGDTKYGTESTASMRKKFTVVSMLETPVTNTVTITFPDDAGTAAAFDATLTFKNPLTEDLTADDLTVTGGVAGTPTTPTKGDNKDKVWTVKISPVVGATEVTVAVVDTLAMGDTVSTNPIGLTPTGADAFAAGSYVVVVRDKDNPPDFGTPAPTLVEWSGMPDLQELFDTGGSVNVKVAGATRLQVVFSEIMWAVDEGKVGEAGYTASQWIELHNRTSGDNAKTFSVSGISLTSRDGRPALPEETDRVSNVVGGGEDWVLSRGQNGNSGVTVGETTTGTKEFISMFRNNYGEPGHQSSRWTKSTELYMKNHRGTPGRKERSNVKTFGATEANRGPVIFNEVSNNETPKYEWIELRNVSDGEVNLKNWEISILTSKGDPPQAGHNAKEMIQFPDADRKVPAGGILLVLASDPRSDKDHPIQTGWDITKGAGDQINGVGAHSPRYIVLEFKDSGMPNDGNFVLVLRNRGDRTASNGDNNTRDVAGYVPGAALKVDDANLFTGLWPLANFPQPNWDKNQLKAGEVHYRQFADIDGTKSKDKNQDDKTAFRNVGWTGIGYRRNADATAQNGGTPGYDNGAIVSEGENAVDPVIISEIMFDDTRNFSQWIELHNTSQTHGVNINNWSIFIVNHNTTVDGGEYDGKLGPERIDLPDSRIPPGQTYLIVSRRGTADTKLPAARIHSVGKKRAETMLNPYGFQITLKAKTNESDANKHQTVDMVGNLGAVEPNNRIANHQSFKDLAWMLPDGTNDDGNRVSINRVPSQKAMMSDGGRIDGMMASAWMRFDMTEQISLGTYYGHTSDVGSPGYTTGGVLPVSLSKFRPERMKDTGEIVIRWVTESELNNAGFNILRSEKRDGEFTKINTKLIAGQGTTSERTTYKYADTSAKPNVVYYYQIQDVSLDGNVTTLRTTHLRGNVTAVGKATTTWGEIKALRE